MKREILDWKTARRLTRDPERWVDSDMFVTVALIAVGVALRG